MFGRATITLGIGPTFLVSIVSQFIYIVTVCDLYWLKIAVNAVRLPKFEPVNGISWSPRKMGVKDLRQRSGLA